MSPPSQPPSHSLPVARKRCFDYILALHDQSQPPSHSLDLLQRQLDVGLVRAFLGLGPVVQQRPKIDPGAAGLPRGIRRGKS